MLTVLPVANHGISYGIWVLKNLVSRYEENVIAIIQIGGEADSKRPSSMTSFIVLLMDGFNFTAFVSHLGTSPETESYSGTGSYCYKEFRDFAMEFQGEVSGIPRLFQDNSREVNQYGFKARYVGFSWDNFFDEALKDLNCKKENLRQEFWATEKGMDWLMNVYRVFLLNGVFTHLWEGAENDD